MSIYDVNGNEIDPQPSGVYTYEREYTDITQTLTFERKIITTSGISDSTTHLLAELPNTGNVEVQFASSRGQFAIFKKSSGGTITMLRDYDWWTYRYTGDRESTYYVCLIYVLSYTSQTLLPIAGKIICRYYQFNDVGVSIYRDIPSSLKNKTIAVIGDSIVQGIFCKNSASTNQQMMKPWTTLISEAVGCEPANFGVGGGLVYNSDIKSVYANCSDVSGFDVVIVCAGTNDYGGNISSGNFDSAFTYVIETLLANNESVIVATPTFRTNKTGNNTQGMSLQSYCNHEKTIASSHGCSVVDIYSLSNTDLFKSHLTDGLHPDEIGHKIIADLILDNA